MRRQGFTLIELLVVVIIMSTLTAIALPQYRRAMDRSKSAEAMQMLPAIFEARERWMIEQGYKWESGIAKKSSGASVTPKFGFLDIESKGTISNTGTTMATPYFTYTLVDGTGAGNATDQPCVSATVRWGGARGLTNIKLYYRGDKFHCYGGVDSQEMCDMLGVESNGVDGCL